MNTKTQLGNRDERYFALNKTQSKILGSIQIWIGSLPMAKFYEGEWFGTYYKVIPLNKKLKIRIPRFLSETGYPYILTVPYEYGGKIDFKIVVTKVGTRNLNSFDLIEMLPLEEGVFTDEGKEIKERDIADIKKLGDNDRVFSTNRESDFHRVGAYIRYYLGKPATNDRRLIIESKIIDVLDGFLPYFFGFVMGILGLFFREFFEFIKTVINSLR